jgi:hypothetical protein
MSKAKMAKDAKKAPAPAKKASAGAKPAPKAGDKKADKKLGAKGKEAPRARPDAGAAASDSKGSKEPAGQLAKRKLGLRGAAPWAARHAAKHAAEARARAAEPAPPGSARATIRTPDGAEQIKARIAELHNQTQRIRALRKRLDKGFFEIGEVLLQIQAQELYVAKGYGSFEAFLEREIDLGKLTSLKIMKIPMIFHKDAALDYGMDRLFAAMSALEGELMPKAAPSTPGSKPLPLPLKPPSRVSSGGL